MTSPNLLRWFASSATLPFPQAAGPVAFALLALSVTGSISGGAAMMLAMVLAQVIGAVPVTRWGKQIHPSSYVRILVGLRTATLLGMAVAAKLAWPFATFIVLDCLAGSVSGAASGYLRALLNGYTSEENLPRALGIAATLNEVTFVLAPVAASALGGLSAAYAIVALAAIGALPLILLPSSAGGVEAPKPEHASASVFAGPIILWLACAAVSGSVIAAIEIGAVGLALSFGYAPTLAVLFTVPLCVASVAGGVWGSVRNRQSSRYAVAIQLCVMAIGSMLGAIGLSLETTLAGALMVGIVVAPLGTHYALVLDKLAPPHRRAEVFALLRTANSVGIIFASAVLTVAAPATALFVVTTVLLLPILVIVAHSRQAEQPT